MTYAIKWSPLAVKELQKLPKEAAKRLVEKLDLAKDNPHHFLERLKGEPGYKTRAGDYRALVDVLDQGNIIAIRVVGHRRNIYKQHL